VRYCATGSSSLPIRTYGVILRNDLASALVNAFVFTEQRCGVTARDDPLDTDGLLVGLAI
jgi:hypothetical protein